MIVRPRAGYRTAMNDLARGVIAGAAGTSALNAVTYLDMAVRGRPASRTPEQTVRRLADTTHVDLGTGERAEHRTSGLGALSGYLVGAAVTAGYALLTGRSRPGWPGGAGVLTALALVAANAPMAAMGVTDPRRWSPADWAADVVPHVAYGTAAAVTLDRLR